jgi:hypothetical protein
LFTIYRGKITTKSEKPGKRTIKNISWHSHGRLAKDGQAGCAMSKEHCIQMGISAKKTYR